jgi:hypothetical protein
MYLLLPMPLHTAGQPIEQHMRGAGTDGLWAGGGVVQANSALHLPLFGLVDRMGRRSLPVWKMVAKGDRWWRV